MAQQGGVNVLSGASHGYLYVKKSDTSAFYEVVETPTTRNSGILPRDTPAAFYDVIETGAKVCGCCLKFIPSNDSVSTPLRAC